MLTEDYRVRLDAFEGPMDLLLFLIRKTEVDIHDIPIARITDQYLEFLKGIERIDIDLAGEFLVLAATLTEIKARMLAPATSAARGLSMADAGPAEDPRADLVRQLLAYKQYKDAATALEDRQREWSGRFPAGACGIDGEQVSEAVDEASEVDVDDLDLFVLAQAFSKIMESVNFERLGDHKVTYDDTPIELHAADILEHIKVGAEGTEASPHGIELRGVFIGRTRSEMIGLFLAVLDLVRRRLVAVAQDGENVFLSARDPDAEGTLPDGNGMVGVGPTT